MKYHQVCVEAFGYTLPEDVITSEQLESRLEPLYRRLELNPGLLEGMFGIRRRHFWPPGTRPSDISILSASKVIRVANLEKNQIGALVHGSVSRDYLEPATACLVHDGLSLSTNCIAYDVSNACLGVLNAVVQIANMIELGEIRAGIAVGTESSRALIDNTIDLLNTNESLTRSQINNLIASLTIGSASVAVLLIDRLWSRTNNRLLAVKTQTLSAGHSRCHTDLDESITGRPNRFMATDASQLIEDGVRLATANFGALLKEAGWSHDDVDRIFCHQVASRPHKLLLESLQIDTTRDFTTFEYLGNTAAVALPLTMALAIEQQFLQPISRVALVGIGSGINSIVLGVQWERALEDRATPTRLSPYRRISN